jgi:hypothetical protein
MTIWLAHFCWDHWMQQNLATCATWHATFLGVLGFWLVTNHVTPVFLCNQGVEQVIIPYNTLIALRVTIEAMFMLTKITKMPSNVLLTNNRP